MDEKISKGKLFIVSTPIGNKSDITYRAVEVLKNCDLVVCEEPKEGAKVLKSININKELDTLNVKNEDEKTLDYLNLLEKGTDIAVISDAGTPVFADPGLSLIRNAIKKEIDVVVVPGASSLMVALVRSGFLLDRFLFAGFLDREPKVRVSQIKRLSNESNTVAIFETPYRLKPLLSALSQIMPARKAYIGFNLTMPFETHHYGTFSELNNKFRDERIKAEFVIVFEGTKKPNFTKNTKYKNYPKNRGR